ncbi:hypothetical protein MOBT1_001258 [Malassezia obtusa]|uniref:Homeobox domain-containing protein n=1 Tax=Malassezia obtusa TaxID=76774 RepID=A0AAF0E3Q1_9BASI|nr:hypothetical protein MOBT1_001258 [Malassezia obtusa]
MRLELDFLDGCLAVLQGLQPETSPAALISPALGAPCVALNLRSINVDAFADAVHERPLASDVQDALVSLFERALQRLKTTFSQHFADAQTRWGASRRQVLPVLHQLFEAQCAMAVQETHDAILAFVDERLDAYLMEANSTHTWPRPHNAKAITILETAFQHAPNITQAEKYKLAEATGLQPRQVTIWVGGALIQFQNRRNRRSTSRRCIKRVGRSTSRPTPPRLTSVPPEPLCREAPVAEVPEPSDPLPAGVALASSTGLPAAPAGAEALGTEWAPPSPEAVVPLELPAPAAAPSLPVADAVPDAPAALSLDHLLQMDNARQCLVFSPLDPLPRLDFADLHLDMHSLEQSLGLGRVPTPLPRLATVPEVPAEDVAAAHALVAQPMHAADEIRAFARTEHWSFHDLARPVRTSPTLLAPTELERLAVPVEGVVHPRVRRHSEAVPTTAPATGPPRWISLGGFLGAAESGVTAVAP